jgi:indolepyruvate decarboxylase
MTSTVTLGTYLCTRLKEAGVKHVFAVVGDYTLPLLHQMSKESGISIINVCNELNGGYAADGYARTGRLAVLIVAYMVCKYAKP